MDSELTNLAAVKAINQGLATTDTVSFSTVNSRNIADDGTKLDTVTQGLAHINEQGIAVWDTDTTYPVSGLAKGSDGDVYKALALQSGNDPTTDDGTNWVDWEVSNRVIRVASVAAMEAYSVPAGYVFSLNAGGRSGTFDVIAGDFSTELAADTENGIYIGLADDPTGTTKVARRRLNNGFLTFEMFGAVGTGNETAEVQAAFDAGIVSCDQERVYSVTGVTTSKYFTMISTARLKYIGSQNGTCLTLDADWGEVYVDGNNEDVTGIVVTNSGSQTLAPKGRLCYSENIRASSTSSTSIYGVSVNGDSIKIGEVITKNTINSGQSNASFPQACGIIGTSDNTVIGKVDCDTGASALVTGSSTGRSFIGTIISKAMTDNGIYGLGGDVTINDFIYQGDEEAFVASGGKFNVGRLTTIGDCVGVLELDTPDEVYIGEIIIKANAAGETAAKAVLTRAGAGDGGRVFIGSITGKILDGSGIFGINTKTLEYLSIGFIDMDINYSSALWGTDNNWFNINTVAQMTLKNMTIRIHDINDEEPATLAADFGTPTKLSLIENFDVFVYDAAGALQTVTDCRLGSTQEFLDQKGARWQTNVGPYAREASYLGGARDSATGPPVGGYWKKGQFLWHGDLTDSSPFVFACTATGTPGTWINIDGA
jgi:hypothetical protein